MNADLESTLAEMGGDYRDLVVRMKAAYEPLSGSRGVLPAAPAGIRRGRVVGWSVAYLVAASLLVLVGLGVVFGVGAAKPTAPDSNAFMLAHLRNAAALDEIIRTQRPDGGWDNDFVTRQNIAALNGSASAEARLAMRKAMRNLRVRGLL